MLLGWLLGVQYARAPVILLVVGNLLNIVLDLWLVMGLRMNVQGAALATVTAEYATLIIGLLMAERVLTLRGVSLAMLKTPGAGSAPFIGVESGHHAALSAAAAVLWRADRIRRPSGQRHRGGERRTDDHADLYRLRAGWLCLCRGGSLRPAYGARDGSQLLEVWRAACRQSGMVALAFALIYSGGAVHYRVVNLTAFLQQLADRYLIWQTILPVVGVWCYLLDGMFIGATRGAEMRNSMAVAAAGFAVTLLTLPVLGNHGLWLALAVFLALRGLSLALIWRRHWRRGTWFS